MEFTLGVSAKMNSYFFTGFPGFLATSLVKKIIETKADIQHFYLLVLPQFLEKAEQEVKRVVEGTDFTTSHFTIIPGDITKVNLKLRLNWLISLKKRSLIFFIWQPFMI